MYCSLDSATMMASPLSKTSLSPKEIIQLVSSGLVANFKVSCTKTQAFLVFCNGASDVSSRNIVFVCKKSRPPSPGLFTFGVADGGTDLSIPACRSCEDSLALEVNFVSWSCFILVFADSGNKKSWLDLGDTSICSPSNGIIAGKLMLDSFPLLGLGDFRSRRSVIFSDPPSSILCSSRYLRP